MGHLCLEGRLTSILNERLLAYTYTVHVAFVSNRAFSVTLAVNTRHLKLGVHASVV